MESGADEALGLSVGAWCVGPGKAVFDAKPFAGSGEQTRAIGWSVVGQQSAKTDTESRVILESLGQEGSCVGCGFIRKDGREGDAGVIVDGHMHILPAHPASAIGEVAGNAMARLGDAAQLFDVQMQQVAGAQMLIALDGAARFEIAGCG